MKLIICSALILSVLVSNAYGSTTETDMKVDAESFDCAKELLPSIDILGRGTEFPAFLIKDISTELQRQDSKSELLSIKCTGEPEITGVFADVEQQGQTQSALEQLNVSFPVEMLVFTGEVNWIMQVRHGYSVSGLTTASPSVKQQFEVIETLNEDGSSVGPIINVRREEQ
jgi:hypothetical protein